MNILIYALGGGWGHLTRAAALASALLPHRATILANSPYLGIAREAMPELSIVPVSSREEVVERIANRAPDALIVDTFPRGLGGELVALLPDCRFRILIHRDLSAQYVAWGNLREFVANHYDYVLCPGESAPFDNLPHASMTAPWLIREPQPVQNPARVVVCASGNAEEMPWYGEVTDSLASLNIDVRCIAHDRPPGCPEDRWVRYWPAIDWIAGADVVVGGAGYNTVNECSATGTPLIARPWPRKYDRQRLRAERAEGVTLVDSPNEAATATVKALSLPRPGPKPRFRNGAQGAAALILKLALDEKLAEDL